MRDWYDLKYDKKINGLDEDAIDYSQPYLFRQSTWVDATERLDSSYGTVSGRQWVLNEVDRYNTYDSTLDAEAISQGNNSCAVFLWHHPKDKGLAVRPWWLDAGEAVRPVTKR